MIARNEVTGFRLKVDLDTRIIGLEMLNASGELKEIQLAGHAIFYLRDQIEEMLEANPEMLHWRKPLPVQH